MGAGRRIVPGAEVAEELLDAPGGVNDGDDAHGVLADGAAQRVHVPDPQDEVTPAFGGQLGRRRWGDTGAADDQLRRQAACSVFYHVRVDVPITLSLLSLKLGRSIRFDPATEKIVGDSEAARLAIPKYRAPWKFPKQYLNA